MTSDEEAEFTVMVLRQSRFVFRVAYAVLLHAQDAEDAVQETFLKLYRNGGWQGMENERAFLARVAWRVAQDSRRLAAGLKHRANTSAEPISIVAEPPSLTPSPEQAAVHGDNEALIHRMIDALPEDLRMPLMLSAFEEFNSREIGAILAIPEGTVRTRIQRARQWIREKLAVHEVYCVKSEHAR